MANVTVTLQAAVASRPILIGPPCKSPRRPQTLAETKAQHENWRGRRSLFFLSSPPIQLQLQSIKLN
jgi:hypothetical protein